MPIRFSMTTVILFCNWYLCILSDLISLCVILVPTRFTMYNGHIFINVIYIFAYYMIPYLCILHDPISSHITRSHIFAYYVINIFACYRTGYLCVIFVPTRFTMSMVLFLCNWYLCILHDPFFAYYMTLSLPMT